LKCIARVYTEFFELKFITDVLFSYIDVATINLSNNI